MQRSKLMLLGLLAGGARAEGLGLISNEARHCVKPELCASLSITSLASPDPALNGYADGLLGPAGADAFTRLDQAGLVAWLQRLTADEADGETSNLSYVFDYSVKQLGESAHHRVLKVERYDYTGGAHGLVSVQFHVLPKAGPLRALNLEDILLPGQRDRLEERHRRAIIRLLDAEDGHAPRPPEKELRALFDAAGHWRFDRRGLLFQYNNYDLAAYRVGLPEILVPTAVLDGIIRPEIRAELESWQEQEPGPVVLKPQWRR